MAGSVKIASNSLSNGAVVAIEMNWVGDAINGSVPDTAFPTAKYACDGFVVSNVGISIGDIAPTSGYTVRVYNSQGIDMLEGAGVGLSTIPYALGVSSNIPPAYGGISISVSGNSVPLAKGKIVVYFRQVSTTQLVQPADATSSAGTALTASDVTSAYAWTRTPDSTVALTAGVAATITLTPMPAGINGSSVSKHYVSVVTGSARKAYLITAVGASSITFTPSLSYAAGSWALQSASGGIQEAIYATSYKSLTVPQGSITYDALRVWNPRKIQLNGQGKDATLIVIQDATANVFLSDEWGLTITNMGFRSLAGAQTAGACVGIVGTTPEYNGDADVNVWDCDFYQVWDAIKCDWPGGFLRAQNNYFRNIGRYACYSKASSAGAIQICDNYADGRTSVGLIWLEGTLAGGIIADNWMQASLAHIVVNAVSGNPVNELVITGNILDQDTAATGCVVVNGNGVEGNSSNCVKISANFFASPNYGVLIQDGWNVSVTDNHMRQRGVSACVAVAGTTSGKIAIKGNAIECESAVQGYSIQISATNTNQCEVSANRGTATATMLAFIGVATTIVSNLHILNNSAGANYTRLLTNTGSVGAGLGVMQGNVAQNTPSVAVSAAATITLPFTDESQVVAISATGTPITEINGILARAGRRVTFLVDGAVTFSTSAATDNKLGVAFGPTAANASVTWAKYSDNLWYVVAKS
jgi:hypothetical protein